MNVLVIPEDFRRDQYVLRPLIRSMMACLGQRRAHVDVCRDPLLGGIAQALRIENLQLIVKANPMVDLFLLCVDRDGEEGRRTILSNVEMRLRNQIKKAGGAFLAENAWQEIEVWLLAGHELLKGWRWNEIRAHRDPKETYYVVLARQRNVADDDSQGRKVLGLEAAGRYQRIRQLCREDILVLEKRVGAWLTDNAHVSWDEAYKEIQAAE